MRKYNVGDKVKVREDLIVDEYYGSSKFNYWMKDLRGKVVTIKSSALKCNGYFVKESSWCLTDEMLTGPVFTKAMLKDGMVVEYGNGTRRMVMGNKLIGMSAWSDLDYGVYTDDLINNYEPDQSIAKVYTSRANTFDSYFSDENLKLIWERK